MVNEILQFKLKGYGSMSLKDLLKLAYQLGIESTYSPAKAKARDKQLDKIINESDNQLVFLALKTK